MLEPNNPYLGRTAAVDNYIEAHDLDALTVERTKEIRRRIQQLALSYDALMRLNARLVQQSDFRMWFDPVTETLRSYAKGKVHSIKINRAHPDVPVKVVAESFMSAYRVDLSAAEQDVLLMEMEVALEGYYGNAWRIIGLVRQLPSRKNFDCPEIREVRNWLSEHPEKRQHAILSFGFGTQGPTIHPMRRLAEKRDLGLVTNTAKFADKLKLVFEPINQAPVV
jgi:hypothetical protein